MKGDERMLAAGKESEEETIKVVKGIMRNCRKMEAKGYQKMTREACQKIKRKAY